MGNASQSSIVRLLSTAAMSMAATAAVARGADYDLVVYGGTAGGIAAAVEASRLGKKVALIEPSQYLGGMSAGGLSYTDTYWPSAVGGIAADFYRRTGRAYGKTTSDYTFEPKVATNIFESMVREASIDVFRNERLDLGVGGVAKSGSTITAIRTESGRQFNGAMFIDATYEGDLMAKSGVSFTTGRESNATYGETYNGVQKQFAFSHNFSTRIDPFVVKGDPSSGLLYGVSNAASGNDGTGDARMQAYNYRLTFTKDAAIKKSWTQPANYDASKYELLARYIQTAGITQVSGKLLKITASPIENGKYDVNNEGAFSTDFIGGNHDYATADYATRDQIVQAHKDYQKGLLYFLATDARLPQSIRTEMNSYGLATDEFVDNDNWSTQLYVREGRRMVGEYVMTDRNVVGKNGVRTTVDDSVGLGTYTMDSHNTQRYVAYDAAKNEYYVKNEGDIQVSIASPYGISYKAITPQEQQASNLIVPVALSASHIAYGSMRMEPTFMILGQTAGAAAVAAMDRGTSVQDVDYATLASQMRSEGQVLTWGNESAATRFVGTIHEDFNYGLDNSDIDVVSYTAGGFSQAWGGGKSYINAATAMAETPNYSTTHQLTYDAPGYGNSASVGRLVSGGAGADGSSATYSAVVSGRGIRGGMDGTIWISALARIDSLDQNQDALLWLDRNANGNVANAGDAFIGLRKGGVIQLRHSGTTNLLEAVSSVYAADETHLLLAKIVMNADGTGYDSVQFWIDPNLLNLGTANLVASGADLFGASFDGIGISIGQGGGALDAIRISNAADGFYQVTAVPEPASWLTTVFGALVLGRLRMRGNES